MNSLCLAGYHSSQTIHIDLFGKTKQEAFQAFAHSMARPREWVTSLINSIPSAGIDASQISNPLRDFPPEGKKILLTIYALFEKELLPALDLLDRNLVSRLLVQSSHTTHAQETRLYMVRSAQQHNHRNSNYEHVNYYEVRLQAWSCSCPAFIFSAFPASVSESGREVEDHDDQMKQTEWLVGGLTRGEDMPICKHLLACLLIEHCSAFSHFVQEREVSMEELGGSAAGWFD